MIRKAKIDDAIYDVISYEEFNANRNGYLTFSKGIAIDKKDGYLYPIRNSNDMRPGFYINESDPSKDEFKYPANEDQQSIYSIKNIIDFSQSKSFRDVIEAQDKLNKAERSILTTVDNITIPELCENDTPFMKAVKTAIIKKHIDLDKYGYRFGNNYPNDKRLLKKDDMTLLKGIAYADCLDFDIYAIIKDNNPDVPNPIGDPIVVKLTGENSGFTSEMDKHIDEITACTTTPTTMPSLNAAFGQVNPYQMNMIFGSGDYIDI